VGQGEGGTSGFLSDRREKAEIGDSQTRSLLKYFPLDALPLMGVEFTLRCPFLITVGFVFAGEMESEIAGFVSI
jgi:hypothetical protein